MNPELKVSSSQAAFGRAAQTQAAYRPQGRHFLASYSGCDPVRLNDQEGLLLAFRRATVAAGATIINESRHAFEPFGFTAMLLLSESHASLHTYPEHQACFVDLFTCGEDCDASAFDEIMRQYLQPGRAEVQTIGRALVSAE